MHLGGAHEIYVLGGMQAVGAMGAGDGDEQARRHAGRPGNAFVAEAKRQLYGRSGSTCSPGRRKTMVIADDTVDAELVATDLLGRPNMAITPPLA